RGGTRYFDWKGTIAKAKAEGWGLSDEEKAKMEARLGRPPTTKEITEATVEQNFEWMRRWCVGDWEYVGVIVTRLPDGEHDSVEPDYSHSLWGIDSDSEEY